MNNSDYLLSVAPVKGCQVGIEVDVLNSRKMGKHKDLSDVDKKQIVMA